MTHLDPTLLYPAECQTCGHRFHDADVLNDNGDCPECEADNERGPEFASVDFFAVACAVALGQAKREAA